LTRIGRLDISEAEYFDILKRKTAYLFSACCEVGAILGGASDAEREALRSYGMDLGIAFQLSDDILDLTATTRDLGKEAGSDLIEGKLTLPLIYLLEKRPELRPQLEKIMLDGEYTTISREDVKAELLKLGLIDAITTRAEEHVAAARKSLDVLSESEYCSSLEDVLSFVTNRNA
ncbi:MAG: polyprenyl synthetase family protein, partial [Pyrinomonadaceae bacterium]